MTNRYIILIKCSDRKGLIFNITQLLFASNLNIVVMKEFVDEETNTFFARAEVLGLLDENVIEASLIASLPNNAEVRVSRQQKKDIVVLVTKEHHCLGDLLLRHYHNELNANIKAVIGNYDRLQELTEKFGIPYHTIGHLGKNRADFEQELMETINPYKPDFIVLAKFMLILSPDFVSNYTEKIVNIHHSFLPAFIGANPYKQAYQRGVKLIGATAHFVNNNLDEGPIVAQKIIPVDHEYTVKGMVEAGHEIEKSVLFNALKLVLEDRVFVHFNKTVIFD
jgi:formyltetrahydrofolate deformylase